MTDTPKDNVTGSPFVASLSADQLRIHEALCDSQFIAGAKAGWNAGCIADPEAAIAAFGALIKSRDGHLEGFANAKAALAAQQALAPKDNLEWSEERSRGALKFIAHGTCGKYTIVSCRPGWRLHLPLFGDEPRFFGYLETAMSAAQADDGILSLEVRVIAEVAKIDRRLSEINEVLGQGPHEDWMRPLEEEFAFLRGRRSILRPNGIPQENGRPQ